LGKGKGFCRFDLTLKVHTQMKDLLDFVRNYILSPTISVAIIALIGFLSRNYLSGWIKDIYDRSLEDYKFEINKALEDYKHDYSKVLEDYKNEAVIKQKAAIIAEFISEWIYAGKKQFANYPPSAEFAKTLNRLSFEAFLWLPKESAIEVSRLLTNDSEAKNFKIVLEEIREHILGNKEKIDPAIIVAFESWN